MSTSPDTATYILEQLAELGPLVRVQKMFGEYALYCGEKVVGLICDDQMFVKITPVGKELVGKDYEEGFPYPGAKPEILISDRVLEDRELFTKLIRATADTLPQPKPKKRKVRK